MKKIWFSTLFSIGIFVSNAQPNRWNNGPRDDRSTWFAITHATLQVSPKVQIKDVTLLIRDGKIVEMGKEIKLPAGAVIKDVAGAMVYPALIDAWSTYGVEVPPGGASRGRGQQHAPERPGAFAVNDAIRTDQTAAELFRFQPEKAERYRKMGIGLTATFVEDGIARGTSAAVFTSTGEETQLLFHPSVGRHFSLNKGSSKEDYPESLMGQFALLRQTRADALWYQNTKPAFRDLALEAWISTENLPDFFETRGEYDALRLAELAKEWKRSAIIKAQGNEYQFIGSLKNYPGNQYILPLIFPDAKDVEHPLDAQNVTLAEMKHWELAPSNPAAFAKNQIPFAFTTSGLKPGEDVFAAVRLALQYGLPYESALAAWTTVPASMLGLQSSIGTLEKGKVASFMIVTDSLFYENSKIQELWVNGKSFALTTIDSLLPKGKYTLNWGSKTYKAEINSGTAISGKIWMDSTSSDFSWQHFQGNVNGSVTLQKKSYRLYGWLKNNGLEGKATAEDGSEIPFSLVWKEATPPDTSTKTRKSLVSFKDASPSFFPQMGLGATKPWSEQPQLTTRINNVTIWTMGKDSVFVGDVLIRQGKIVRVGRLGDVEDVEMVIDGTGKHLTPGLIDEHSHIAITRGVNEGTRNVTSECDIDDALDCSDINIYRQLSGGVTTSHLLHGSANPIGGQTALIKLRWGATSPFELRFQGADPFIKFALGENVKQSNWGMSPKTRYPQSRMGVEQVYFDAFSRAKEYEAARKKWMANGSKKELEPRPDYTLETLVRILNNKEFITCHSYVQSEINMLMHVADSIGFKVNTFTHVLEGYKVAKELKAHGAYASTFSDWWAYKYEVVDAIPHNAALLTQAGVVTCINSDDAEMARRLNQEAAKTIKYGGLSPVQALATVTINPAKALHIDGKVGSIEVGKDADLVLWSHHPLSIDAKVEMTLVDGKMAFNREEDAKNQNRMQAERQRLILKMLEAKKGGKPTSKPVVKEKRLYHCDTIGD